MKVKMITVKICGITNKQDVEAAVKAGVDMLGFVVGVPSSPRNISQIKLKRLLKIIPHNVKSVAVTVFKSVAETQRIFKEINTDYIQLHGNYYKSIQFLTEIPKSQIIAAIDGKTSNALDYATEFSEIFQYVLLDAAGYDGRGGTGTNLNWDYCRLIRETIYPKPLILAGGLTPKNVNQAVQNVKPTGVDVSSGVEREFGIKDRKKIIEFVKNAKETKI